MCSPKGIQEYGVLTMDFYRLEIFCRVVELQSITRAAEELHLTQPAVSQQIRKLEKSLGVRLFERKGRDLVPSAEGNLLYRYARAIIDTRNEAVYQLRELCSGRSGRLTIGASTTGVLYYLPRLLRSYRQAYPNVELVVRAEITDRIREAVASAALDLGFIWGPVADPRLETVCLGQDDFAVIVHPDSALAKEETVEPQVLAREVFILAEEGSTTRKFVEGRLREVGIVPRVVMSFSTTEAMKRVVEGSLGVAVVSRKAVSWELQAGSLRRITVRGLNLRRDLMVVWRRDRELPPSLRALIEMAPANFFGER